jgi:antitoxin component YwqK of YwqJK toxin-antitoxin module
MLHSYIFSFVMALGSFQNQAIEQDSLIVEHVQEQPTLNIVDGQGRRQGTWVTYHPNNMLQSIAHFVDDKLEGPYIQISDRGYLLSEEHFKNDQYHGTQRYFNLGVLSKLAMYKDGVYDGVVETYHRNRNIAERHFYENGQKHGLSTWFFESGEPSFVYEYQNGLIEGKVTTYHKNGMLKSETHYQKNQMHGPHVELHEQGTLAAQGNYHKGEQVGEWFYYNERGDLERKEKFKKK